MNFARSISGDKHKNNFSHSGEEVEIDRRMMFTLSKPIERRKKHDTNNHDNISDVVMDNTILNKSSKWKTC